MTKKRAKQSADVKSNCEPSQRERAATSNEQRVPDPALPADSANQAPELRLCKRGNVTSFTFMCDRETLLPLMDGLGSRDPDFFFGLVDQVANASSRGSGRYPDEQGIKFMLSVIKGIAPRDQIEAMLASQMAAVHVATMKFANRLTHAADLPDQESVGGLPDQESAERAFVKLARTFAALLEALKRYRTGGEQKVTVQHVSVSEGGQAIVGNVNQSAVEKPANETPALTDARQSAMPIIDTPQSELVPVRHRRKLVPVGRRRRDGQRHVESSHSARKAGQ